MLVDAPLANPDTSNSARATLLLAHGAGAPMDSAFMEAMAKGLCALGITVVRFEFPYMAARRAGSTRPPPNRMPVLEASFRALVAAYAEASPLFIGGKSMGGRVATMIADSVEVAGVIALGYPFHPPKRPDKLRVEHLAALRTPCLIVQGSRDALGSQAEVEHYELARATRVHWLEDGDHSFEPRRSSGRTTTQNWAEAIAVCARFMLVPGARRPLKRRRAKR